MDDIFEHSIDNDNFYSLLEAGLLESDILIGIVALARSYRCVVAISIWKASLTIWKANEYIQTLQIVKQDEFNLSLCSEPLYSEFKENRQHG